MPRQSTAVKTDAIDGDREEEFNAVAAAAIAQAQESRVVNLLFGSLSEARAVWQIIRDTRMSPGALQAWGSVGEMDIHFGSANDKGLISFWVHEQVVAGVGMNVKY